MFIRKVLQDSEFDSWINWYKHKLGEEKKEKKRKIKNE